MSYCRWTSDCDVYVYEDTRGGWTTRLIDGRSYNNRTPKECAETLSILKEGGYRVPDDVIQELESEQVLGEEEE